MAIHLTSEPAKRRVAPMRLALRFVIDGRPEWRYTAALPYVFAANCLKGFVNTMALGPEDLELVPDSRQIRELLEREPTRKLPLVCECEPEPAAELETPIAAPAVSQVTSAPYAAVDFTIAACPPVERTWLGWLWRALGWIFAG